MPVDERLRVALIPYMVVGHRTEYENLRLVAPSPDMAIDALPIEPYVESGFIEQLPVLRPRQKGRLRSLLNTWPLLSRHAYDALWTAMLPPLLPFLLACDTRLKQRPAIVLNADSTPALMDGFYEEYYGSPPPHGVKRQARDLLHRYLLRHCTVVAPLSQWAARSFVRTYGVPEERIRVIPPGVDLGKWSVPATKDGDVAELTQGHPFRLLFVGGDFERKGGPLLLDVFHRSLRETCELHVVTKAPVAEGNGVTVYRSFGANADGLRELYGRCDALVLPTRADVFSIASIEAMASGLPVITTPIGGIPEIVRHGETGFLVPVDDGSALLEAIQTLVRDPARAGSMGLAGRRVAEERFDNSRNATEVFDLLRDLARQSRYRQGMDS